MMNEALSPASIAQNEAADPSHSSFVAANAGSGKTTVLANRIARLLLHGANPSHILCVTFTKAAASEVQNRVFELLGEWVLLDDDDLKKVLFKIGETNLSKKAILRARRLFASAMDAPGGLRLQTIHGFCSSVLRRFPIEAGVSPSFQEMDDNERDVLFRQIIQTRIADGELDHAEIESFLHYVKLFKGQVPDSKNDFFEMIGFNNPFTLSDIQALFASLGDVEDIFARLRDLAGSRNKRFVKAPSISDDEMSIFYALKSALYDSKNQLRSFVRELGVDTPIYEKKFENTDLNFVHTLLYVLEKFVEWLYVENAWVEVEASKIVLADYERRKNEIGLLDYDDLIFKTKILLSDEARLSWVMYKLDSQIDHLLIDEAQDTNSDQWEILNALAQNVGEDPHKTIFVVGDPKQSIFGFQGAEPKVFNEMHNWYREKLSDSEYPLHDGEMQTSFRSSPLILDFVDEVFSGDLAQFTDVQTPHNAFKKDIPGQIEIWPIEPYEAIQKASELLVPIENVKQNNAVNLARKLAKQIAFEIKSKRQIFDGKKLRNVKAGDYLILVRARDIFYTTVQKELTKENVPIAGIDRIKLKDELVYKDIMALLKVIIRPFDDMSMAAILKSPIFDFDDQMLFTLSKSKKGKTLLQTIYEQKNQYENVIDLIEFGRQNADFLRPYDFLNQIIIKFGLLEKFVGRLGEASNDVIEGILAQALAYENKKNADLLGFIEWAENLSSSELKRELVDDGSAVRVMTVHGAKGLEANIVILPYNGPSARVDSLVYKGGIPIKTSKRLIDGFPLPQIIGDLAIQSKMSGDNEFYRLLYVALTRARARFVLLPYETNRLKMPDDKAYNSFVDAFEKVEGNRESIQLFDETLIRSLSRDQPILSVKSTEKESVEPKRLELSTLETRADEVVHKLAPSTLFSQSYSEEESGRGAEFGNIIHHLLEYYKRIPEQNRLEYVKKYIEKLAVDVEPIFVDDEASKVMAKFPHFFDKYCLAENSFQLSIGSYSVQGRIDVLRIHDEIDIVDFKSNIEKETNWESLSEVYRGQLMMYYLAVKENYPDKKINAHILWTHDQSLLTVNQDELQKSAQILQADLEMQK